MSALKLSGSSGYTQDGLYKDLALTAFKAGVYSGPVPSQDPRVSSALMELFMGLLTLNAMREIDAREKMIFYVANWKARHKATGAFNPADFAVHDPVKIVDLLVRSSHENLDATSPPNGTHKTHSVPAHWTL